MSHMPRRSSPSFMLRRGDWIASKNCSASLVAFSRADFTRTSPFGACGDMQVSGIQKHMGARTSQKSPYNILLNLCKALTLRAASSRCIRTTILVHRDSTSSFESKPFQFCRSFSFLARGLPVNFSIQKPLAYFSLSTAWPDAFWGFIMV